MTKFVLVSQGIAIYITFNKDEAYSLVEEENKGLYDYKQKCIDKHEPYADTEIVVVEEEASEKEYEEWRKNKEN